MANSSTHPLRHKRSQAKGLISIPIPTSSSTFMFDQPQPQQQTNESRPRFSGESLTPNDGYSGLFTSGLIPNIVPIPSPTSTIFPSPPKMSYSQQQQQRQYQHQYRSPSKLDNQHSVPPTSYSGTSNNSGGLMTTPTRRRRSSIIHTTPSSVSPKKLKSVGIDNGVERALDNVMRNLKVSITPNNKKMSYNSYNTGLKSRWSSSTEGSPNLNLENIDIHEEEEEESHKISGKPRKSSETTRSKLTIVRSTRNKSRKSQDTERSESRMEIDIESANNNIPDVPPIPSQIPVTPGRSRRMMNGLVKRLGLTPKKSKQSLPPPRSLPKNEPPLPPPMPLPTSDLPLPPAIEDRTIPKKSSLSTLRSALTKKSSNTTLRSFKSSAHYPNNPFAHDSNEIQPPVPFPTGLPKPSRYEDDNHVPDCFSTTPKTSTRTPKSSIGQPKLQNDVSPSKFLNELPRKAPITPKRETFYIDSDTRNQHLANNISNDTVMDRGVIKFEEEESLLSGDIMMLPSTDTNLPELDNSNNNENSLEINRSQEIFTPISKSTTKPTQAQVVIQQTLDSLTKNQLQCQLGSPFQPNQSSTPTMSISNTKPRPAGLTIDSTKKTLLGFHLGSPVNIKNPPSSSATIGSSKLRSKKSTEQFKFNKGVSPTEKPEPLSMKNINSMGLPAPPPENRSIPIGKASSKNPLGIMKRFKSSKPATSTTHMDTIWPIPFPEPKPSGEIDRKIRLNLGTSESHFDENLGTFGTPTSSSYQHEYHLDNQTKTINRDNLPDFTIPLPPNSNHTSYNSHLSSSDSHEGMENDYGINGKSRFQDQHDQDFSMGMSMGMGNMVKQSPEYFFQLEKSSASTSNDEIDIDQDDSYTNDNSHYQYIGNSTYIEYEESKNQFLHRKQISTSNKSEHTIHTMTTGEGVEEWELERYLKVSESEEIRHRGEYV
ncbi:uncharacterized protein L201_003902 [Kwoniella dendrophila CBS 6074]|uniref:Uncharacterized protein n=1 Tax=Kwoniella dendrophila CBS 6074 TaxID=1295534 RepID=A0AAX4JUW3_9TREE